MDTGVKVARAGRAYRFGKRVWLLIAIPVVVIVAGLIAYDLAREGLAFSKEPAGVGTMQLVPSKSLTVTIQPLVPSEQVLAAVGRSAAYKEASEYVTEDGVQPLQENLSKLFPFTYKVADPLQIPDEYFSFDRGQYNVDKVLTWMIKQRDKTSYKTVGVLAVDIYAPDFNFLYGLAKLGGTACVASCNRMGQKGGLTFDERWHIIVRHELGHTLGMRHVPDRKSVMCFSNSIDELDQSSAELTNADWAGLRESLPVHWQRDF